MQTFLEHLKPKLKIVLLQEEHKLLVVNVLRQTVSKEDLELPNPIQTVLIMVHTAEADIMPATIRATFRSSISICRDGRRRRDNSAASPSAG